MSKAGAKAIGSSNPKESTISLQPEVIGLSAAKDSAEAQQSDLLQTVTDLPKSKTPQQINTDSIKSKSQTETTKLKTPKLQTDYPKLKFTQLSPGETSRTRHTASRQHVVEPSKKSFFVDEEISIRRSVSSGGIPTPQDKVREFMKRVVKRDDEVSIRRSGSNESIPTKQEKVREFMKKVATPRVRRHHRTDSTESLPETSVDAADSEADADDRSSGSNSLKRKRKYMSEIEKLVLDDQDKPKSGLKFHTANLQKRKEQLLVKRHIRGKVRLAQGLKAHARINSPPHASPPHKVVLKIELPKEETETFVVPEGEQILNRIEGPKIAGSFVSVKKEIKTPNSEGKLKRKYKRKFGTYQLGKARKKPKKKPGPANVSVQNLSDEELDSSKLDATNELDSTNDDDLVEDSSVIESAVSSYVEADSDVGPERNLDESSVIEDDVSNMEDLDNQISDPEEAEEGQQSEGDPVAESDLNKEEDDKILDNETAEVDETYEEDKSETAEVDETYDEDKCETGEVDETYDELNDKSTNGLEEDSVALPSEEPNSPNSIESAKINGSKLTNGNKPQKARKSSNAGSGMGESDGSELVNGEEETSKPNASPEENLGVAGSVKKRHDIKRKLMETEDGDTTTIYNSDFVTPTKKIKKADDGGTPTANSENEEYKEKDAGIIVKPPDDDLAPCLCTCRIPEGFIQNPIALNMDSLRHEIVCQAVDSVDEKLIGCCNLVSSKWLCRPSARIPFHPLCDIHRARLRYHHCCPSCGFFCTQGAFILCTTVVDKNKSSAHLFHRKCWLRSNNGDIACPHCGINTGHDEIRLKLNCPRNPFILKEALNKTPKARMSVTRDMVIKLDEPKTENLPGLDVIPGKRITVEDLPAGPERDELTSILEHVAEAKSTTDDVKYTMKNFYKSAKEGELEKITEMLKLGFDPGHNFEEYFNRTALHAAALNGHYLVAYLLLQAGSNPDSIDDNRSTPLMLAVENRQLRLVQLLIKAGTHLEARGEDGMTVLHLSAKVGNLEACECILNTGKINVNIQDDGGWTSLVWAAEHKHVDLAALLLERGSDPNISDVEGNVALHWAALSGNAQICELLINRCDTSCINDPGDTPLHIAARQDNYECTSVLLNKKADPTIKNKAGETPIMCCLDQTSMTYLLLSVNVQLKDIADKRARTTRVVHPDISCGKEPSPIQCINAVDDEPLPTNYLYVMENCETSRLNIDRTINCLQGCSCTDDCTSPTCTCGNLSLKCWFTREGRLIPEFNLLDPPMLFECNRACRCWKKCNNRVVQHGIMCHLQLFRTVGRGWGVRTLQDIPKGTFVCEYVGELISDQEADHRADDSYLFDLDNRDEETYCIDARHYGNIARFINHLCLPNLVSVKVFIDHQDLRFPRIALFSSRDIKAYEELGFDYGDKFWIIKYKSFTCACGYEKCKYSSQTIHTTLANYSRRLTEDTETSSSK